MKFKEVLIKIFLWVIAGIFFSSCATILGGKSNTLVFSEESLPKAEVFIDGEKIGEAPGKIKVPKEKIQHGSILVLKADGFEVAVLPAWRPDKAMAVENTVIYNAIPINYV